MKVLFQSTGNGINRELSGHLRAFYESHGHRYAETTERSRRPGGIAPDLRIVWNGRGPSFAELEGLNTDHQTVIFVEVGWLPQAETFFGNYYGTTGKALWPDFSPTIPDGYTAWKIPYLDRMERVIVSGTLPPPGKSALPEPPYVLVVGQLERDTSMLGSPIRTMRDLLACVVEQTDLPIVFRPHPGEPSDAKLAKEFGVALSPASPLYPTLRNASYVVGVSSTCLLEAALVGTPAVCLGKNVWSDLPWPYTIPRSAPDDLSAWLTRDRWDDWDPEPMCAFLWSKQISRFTPAFDPAFWLGSYRRTS